MLAYRAWFACINKECDKTYSLDEIVYTCAKCGDLLQVVHDDVELGKRSAEDWKLLFNERYRSNTWPYGSGVWGKKELVCPNIDDSDIVSLYEGNTNLFWAERLGKEIGLESIWIKQCGNSHTGSFKDLGMTVLVSMVKKMIGKGSKIKAIACASTGDTSASLAAYCATAGIPAIVFLPRNKVSTAQLIQPIANGALVLALDSDFDGCMKVVKEICEADDIYLANSMNSLRIEGQKTISIEIVQQFGWKVPDWIIIPGGNLGNVSALGKGLLMMEKLGIINKRPRIVLAQSAKANPLYLSYKKDFKEFKPIVADKTLASAIQIGDPVSVNRAISVLKEFDGIVEQATESELVAASVRGDYTGMFNCPHTGVALASLFKLLKRKVISKNDSVVIISTAHGLKFCDFKIQYHNNELEGINSVYANKAVNLSLDVSKIRDSINRYFDTKEGK